MKKMSETCHNINNGEILNADKMDYPLFQAVFYGDRVLCAKLSKRLSCAIRHLSIRVKFTYVYDTHKAIEKGITKDPTLMLNGNIFIEGLVETGEITEKFKTQEKKNNE